MDEVKIWKHFEEPLEKGIEIYTNNAELRNSITQIPIIGVAFDQITTGLSRDFQKRRFLEVIQLLRQEMNLIEESKVDKEFLKTEEFLDLIVKVVENSVKTRHKDRILLNCKILTGSLLKENNELRHSSEDLLVLVSDLSPIDIKVAREIYNQQKDKPDKFNVEDDDKHNELAFVIKSGWDNLQTKCNLNQTDFLLSLHKLSDANLINQIIGNYASYLGGKFITPTFQRLMSILSYSKEPLFNYNLGEFAQSEV
jgi:hypothetical protein